MIIAIDLDGTIVEHSVYADTSTDLQLKVGARDALLSLKRAGHTLVLWSGRASRSLFFPWLDPLIQAGVTGDASTDESRQLHADRYRAMLRFVDAELPGIFAVVDSSGSGGKINADIFIDDRAIQFGGARGMTWPEIAALYGD